MEIFKLVGSIMVDSSEAEKSISKTEKSAEGLGGKLASGIKTAGKWAAGLTAGAVAVGGAMLAAAKDTASQMDVIDKASQRMGISAESYQELAHAANLCGVEMGTMEKAAKNLEKTGEGLTFDEAMEQIMGISDAEQRAARAAELFGDSVAYTMTPMLNAADSFDEMKQEARDLGLVMSNEAVAGGAAMNDQFAKIEGMMKSVKTTIIAELMPYLSQILDWVISNMPAILNTVKGVINAIMPIVKPLLDMLMKFLPGFLNLFQSVMAAITPPIEWLAGMIADVVGGVMDIVSKGASFIGGLFGGGKADGSHAAGLATVPYDGYRAELHKGETVLNANDTSKLMELINNGGSSGNQAPINITVQSILDGQIIGENTYKYINRRERAMGV